VALSSTESEYVAVTNGAQEALWIKSLMSELGFNQSCITLFEDNEGCINLSNNPQEFKRTRHVQVKYHFIRHHVRAGTLKLQYVETANQLADIFTKGVSGPKLINTLKQLQVYPHSKPGRVSINTLQKLIITLKNVKKHDKTCQNVPKREIKKTRKIMKKHEKT